MKTADLQQLQALARLRGVQTSYLDMAGRPQAASPEVLLAVLDALGAPANGEKEIRGQLQETLSRHRKRRVEPVVVAWDRRPLKIELNAPANAVRRPIHCRLQLESGETREFSRVAGDAPLQGRAGVSPARAERSEAKGSPAQRPLGRRDARPTLAAHQLTLPALPFGYHQLEIEIGNRLHRTLIISAPGKSYSEPGVRAWGMFLPMYAAHSRQSWGTGNFSDWEQLCDWVGSAGGTIAGALPLLAAFLDFPTCDPSPYSPASRLFWNEFYLDITRIPEFSECAAAQKLAGSTAFQNRLAAFRQNTLVDYKAEWAARRKVLELLAGFFFENKSPRQAGLKRFLRERPALQDYARFRAVCDKTKTSWRHWPRRLRDGDLCPGDYDESSERFHLYAQWQAQEQMNGLIARCRDRRVKLYLDLPLGVHPDGYDVWRERESFALDARAGAPPDAFFAKGQDWGFAPLHPGRIRESGYRHVRDYLRFQMRHTGLLRIDHVMGLHRLFWIPKGFSATHGAYVNYHADELHAIFNLESHRHRTMLVGENLGTVPPEVNRALKRHRLREMFVTQFQQRPDPKAALREPPRLSVASLNTHDMPTFAAHWKGDDIQDLHELGLIPNRRLKIARRNRKELNAALLEFLSDRRFLNAKPTAAAVLKSVLGWLAASPAEIILVNLEDLLLEKHPQNVPGTYRERPNWRRKARLTLEQIFQNPEVRTLLGDLTRRRKSG